MACTCHHLCYCSSLPSHTHLVLLLLFALLALRASSPNRLAQQKGVNTVSANSVLIVLALLTCFNITGGAISSLRASSLDTSLPTAGHRSASMAPRSVLMLQQQLKGVVQHAVRGFRATAHCARCALCVASALLYLLNWPTLGALHGNRNTVALTQRSVYYTTDQSCKRSLPTSSPRV